MSERILYRPVLGVPVIGNEKLVVVEERLGDAIDRTLISVRDI